MPALCPPPMLTAYSAEGVERVCDAAWQVDGAGWGQGVFEIAPTSVRPAHNPSTFSMTSMAEDAGGHCVGIALSGTDHDGTVGLKSIRNAGGLTIVQAPGTAEFPDMPNSHRCRRRGLGAHTFSDAFSAVRLPGSPERRTRVGRRTSVIHMGLWVDGSDLEAQGRSATDGQAVKSIAINARAVAPRAKRSFQRASSPVASACSSRQ